MGTITSLEDHSRRCVFLLLELIQNAYLLSPSLLNGITERDDVSSIISLVFFFLNCHYFTCACSLASFDYVTIISFLLLYNTINFSSICVTYIGVSNYKRQSPGEAAAASLFIRASSAAGSAAGELDGLMSPSSSRTRRRRRRRWHWQRSRLHRDLRDAADNSSWMYIQHHDPWQWHRHGTSD